MESPEYWKGFFEALELSTIEVDKILSKCYNDRRIHNDLLDTKLSIEKLRELATDENSVLPTV